MSSSATILNVNWVEGEKLSVVSIPKGATTSDEIAMGDTLWLFLDESGNFDFAITGTKYFIMTCLATRRPFTACHDLMITKYDFNKKGISMKKFHATEDSNAVKTAVYETIERHGNRLAAYSFYVDKEKLPEELKDAGNLYYKVFEWIVSEVLANEADASNTHQIIVVTDELPQEAKKKRVVKPLKTLLKAFTNASGIPAYIEHFPSESDYNLQIADYLCWAFMRKEAQGKSWPFDKVSRTFAETGWLNVEKEGTE